MEEVGQLGQTGLPPVDPYSGVLLAVGSWYLDAAFQFHGEQGNVSFRLCGGGRLCERYGDNIPRDERQASGSDLYTLRAKEGGFPLFASA